MAEETVDTNPKIRLEKSNLNKYIDNFFEMISLYDDNLKRVDINGNEYYHKYKDLLKASIDVFLSYQSTYTAFQVYETFSMIYQILPEDKNKVDENSPDSLISEPNILLNLIEIMRTYEENTGELINRQRDHFIHSVNVFILGLAIYAQNKNYRNVFKEYILANKKFYSKYYRINGKYSHEEFLYRWGLASLFHDIGYPFEIIGKQLDKIIEDTVSSISVNYDVDAHVDYRDFNEFNSIVKIRPYDYADEFRESFDEAKALNLFKPTDIMVHKMALDFKFDEVMLKRVMKHLDGFVKYMNENGFVDHGYFSAILVLNSYGKLIQKYKLVDNKFFFYPIVDSATAILLHNYYHNSLQKIFGLEKLQPSQSPISYLLILCDELQEWNRRPYGLLDKMKNHVNDMDVYIDDKRMEVEYILKNGSMGLGFSKKKDNFIDEVLDVEKIFPGKLYIHSDVKLDKIQREIIESEIQAPDVLLRNIERLARQINEQYNETTKRKLEEYKEEGNAEKIAEYEEKVEYLKDFDDLDPDYKMSNIRQAKTIPKKLSMIGCEIAHIQDPREEITEFSTKDVEDLAIYEHNEWWEEREGMGWIYGPVKIAEKRISPYLVSWDELEEDKHNDGIKDYDRDAVKNIPTLLNSIGLKVVRSRFKVLTYKMNELYETNKIDLESDGKERFDELNKNIQFSNYKQTEDLIKILKEKGFELVSVDDIGDPVEAFDEEDICYFAKREHEAWYKLKFNMDDTSSKNFVPWDNVSDELRNKNKQTFARLPEVCAHPKVGLKIIRSA